MRDELMDKGMDEDAFDKACDKYGFDPDDVSEYMDKKMRQLQRHQLVELDEYSNPRRLLDADNNYKQAG